MEACGCKWGERKMAEVQCGSLLVTERRTVRTMATPRHSPFISRHRQMKNHCESATSVCINITKPRRRERGAREGGRRREREGGGEVDGGRERPQRLSFRGYPKSNTRSDLTNFPLLFF